MSIFQRVIALTVIACMPYGDCLTILRAETPPNAVLAKQQVDLFGVGAEVKVRLASGKKLRGAIEAIDTSSFALMLRRDGSLRQITHDEVAELKLAKSTYRASARPNPEEARRVAAGLGVGKHVAVKVTSGKTFRGNLKAINEDYFVLLPDRQGTPIEIAYGDVEKLGPNLSTGATIAIVVAVVVTGIVIVALVAADEVSEAIKP